MTATPISGDYQRDLHRSSPIDLSSGTFLLPDRTRGTIQGVYKTLHRRYIAEI
jgi:hypothetical protein